MFSPKASSEKPKRTWELQTEVDREDLLPILQQEPAIAAEQFRIYTSLLSNLGDTYVRERSLMLQEQERSRQIGIDLSRAKEHIEQLEIRCQDLDDANRTRDEFLSVLSHELRTPLTPIMSWVAILRECGPEDRELFDEGLETIERCVEGELNIIEELLDLTRILNNKVRLEHEVVDPSAVLALAERFTEGTSHERTLDLKVVPAEHPEPIWADPKRLLQVRRHAATGNCRAA